MPRKSSRKTRTSRTLSLSVKPVSPPAALVLSSMPKQTKLIIGGVIVLVILLFAFPLRFLIVPAVVNGQPIFSWQYLGALHKQAGQQVLNQLINEKLVEQEISQQGIQVSQEEIDAQIKQIEDQFGQQAGGLDALLSLQGLTKDEFLRQLRLNLSLEKLVKGTIQISDEDIQAELTKNKEIYQNLSEVDAATTAAENLRSDRMQDAFQTWFEQLRSTAKILNFFTQSPLQLPKLPQPSPSS